MTVTHTRDYIDDITEQLYNHIVLTQDYYSLSLWNSVSFLGPWAVILMTV